MEFDIKSPFSPREIATRVVLTFADGEKIKAVLVGFDWMRCQGRTYYDHCEDRAFNDNSGISKVELA